LLYFFEKPIQEVGRVQRKGVYFMELYQFEPCKETYECLGYYDFEGKYLNPHGVVICDLDKDFRTLVSDGFMSKFYIMTVKRDDIIKGEHPFIRELLKKDDK
jgi:hypothetical protein